MQTGKAAQQVRRRQWTDALDVIPVQARRAGTRGRCLDGQATRRDDDSGQQNGLVCAGSQRQDRQQGQKDEESAHQVGSGYQLSALCQAQHARLPYDLRGPTTNVRCNRVLFIRPRTDESSQRSRKSGIQS